MKTLSIDLTMQEIAIIVTGLDAVIFTDKKRNDVADELRDRLTEEFDAANLEATK